jgi:hypothetical protein
VSRSTTKLGLAAVIAVTTALAAGPAVAPAVVPPRDCGNMKVSGKRYQIKVDQISCKDGKGYAKKYIVNRSKPRGYRCKQYPSKRNRVRFYCNNGRRVFFAIRR